MPASQSNRPEYRSFRESEPIRVMVVDDSAVIRGLITRWIKSDSGIDVVSSAANGLMAVNSLAKSGAEVVVLDIEMPQMDGLTAIPKLLAINPDIKIIMASTLTRRGAEISIRALAAGAADYVPKPESNRDAEATLEFQRLLIEKIRALGGSRARRAVPRATGVRRVPQPGRAPPGSARSAPMIVLREASKRRPEVVGIGSSTGGPQALLKVLSGFKRKIEQPILVVQHMPPTFTAILAEHLARATDQQCAEAEDGERLLGGRIYIAPGDFHFTVERRRGELVARLSKAAPENYCRPAVDQLFRSLAKAHGASALTVMLTGMGQDGLQGSRQIIEAGGTLIAQDEDSSVVWGMPGAVATAGLCHAVLPLPKISEVVLRLTAGKRP